MQIKTPVIHQEYKRHNSCSEYNNSKTEQFLICICVNRVTINTVDKLMQ